MYVARPFGFYFSLGFRYDDPIEFSPSVTEYLRVLFDVHCTVGMAPFNPKISIVLRPKKQCDESRQNFS